MEIIPSILTDNPAELRDMLDKAEGAVKRVHIDIIDGVFVDNQTIDPSVLNDLEHDLMLDFHLMVNEPVKWVEKCARAGADRIIGQVEMMSSVADFIEAVTETGLSLGLALDVDTDVNMLDKKLLTDVDVVLVMSVPAGFGGQKFHDSALQKIKTLTEIKKGDQTPFKICDDGGITLEKLDDLAMSGADEVVIGRRLFDGDLKANIEHYGEKIRS